MNFLRLSLVVPFFLLLMAITGCSSFTTRFSEENKKRGEGCDYFSEEFAGSRYYMGASAAINGRGALGSMRSYNSPTPSDELGALLLVIPATLSLVPKIFIGVDIVGSAVCDTLFLPLDFSIQQFDQNRDMVEKNEGKLSESMPDEPVSR